jgi:SsrA-binding protein
VLAGEVFLMNLHIGPYRQGNQFNHEPYRKRRLLLQRRQIRYLDDEIHQKRLALIPLQMYFRKQWVKVELALARGRRSYDKREKIAKEENKRRIARLMAESRRR